MISLARLREFHLLCIVVNRNGFVFRKQNSKNIENISMTNKTMEKDLDYYKDWYFLRDGDFLPERVSDSKYHHDRHMLQIFISNGALFENKEDAINAGNAIRSFLLGNQLSLQSKELHRKYNRLTPGEVSQVFRNLLEETLNNDCKHTQSACACHKDVENDSPRTVLIKIFHP